MLARRFLREYRARDPRLSMDEVRWYAGLHSSRVLAELSTWREADDPRARTHPFRQIAPGATKALRRATGTAV
jgi:hypothetical protein